MGIPQQSSHKKRFLVCFSPKDGEGKAELVAHLAPVRRSLTLWSVDVVSVGESIREEFRQAAASADGALLLLSADFFADLEDPLFAEQVEALRKQHQERGLQLVPILWRACEWQAVDWLAALKPLPVDGSAISSLGDKAQRDLAFAQIARHLDDKTPRSKKWKLLAACALPGVLVGAVALGLQALERTSAVSPVDAAAPDYSIAATLWKVEGLVRDPHGRPLAGVSVSLPERDIATVTSEHGSFHLAVPAERGELVLVRVEMRTLAANGKPRYRPQEVHANLGSTKLDIQLMDNP